MANLFIAYDLMSPGQSYDTVRDAIKRLGQWHQFQFSLFYVHTHYTVAEAYQQVIAAMDATDRLMVIEANGAVFTSWDQPPTDAINGLWYTQAR